MSTPHIGGSTDVSMNGIVKVVSKKYPQTEKKSDTALFKIL